MSRAGQWDAAIALVREDFGNLFDGCKQSMMPGVVVRNTRLFLKGDVVVVYCSNGGAERFDVFGKSSRGYTVRRLMMRGQAWKWAKATHWVPERHDYRYRDKLGPGLAWYRGPQCEQKRFQAGPLKLVELPDDLAKLSLDDPAVRQYVVGSLCTDNEPHPG